MVQPAEIGLRNIEKEDPLLPRQPHFEPLARRGVCFHHAVIEWLTSERSGNVVEIGLTDNSRPDVNAWNIKQPKPPKVLYYLTCYLPEFKTYLTADGPRFHGEYSAVPDGLGH